MNGTDTEQGYIGGLDWEAKIFQWHPLMMVSGLIFSFVWAALSFRIFMFGKPVNKLIHALLHTASVTCFSIGLYAVFAGNNDEDKNGGNYYPNLASLHSWLGLGTITLYLLNYVSGAVFFLTSWFSPGDKKVLVRHHMSLGIVLLVMAGLAAETGIMELVTESAKCDYALNTADTNPAEHYSELLPGCKLANGAGLLVLVAVLCTIYAVVDVRQEDIRDKSELQPLV